MAEYIVKDRQTGEILCQGTRQKCADYLGCDAQYVKSLVRTPPKYEKESKYSKYLVERHGEVKQGGARLRDVICCDCGVLMKNVGASRLRCPDCVIKFNRDRNKQIIREKRNASPVSLNMKARNTKVIVPNSSAWKVVSTKTISVPTEKGERENDLPQLWC